MYPTSSFEIQQVTKESDGIGGYNETWKEFKAVEGYLDLVTGTDLNNTQNAITEDSTHLLIIPDYLPGITDKMRVVAENRTYDIDYVDDPVGIHHHIELYLTFGGYLDG